jgi:hypothetical protein
MMTLTPCASWLTPLLVKERDACRVAAVEAAEALA